MPVKLNHVSDNEPGLKRKCTTLGFRYLYPDGRPVRDRALIKRINALAIPPAYTDIWICPDPRGHIQATGRDARGRKQYRYHPEWDHVRNAAKYERMLAFGKALPKIRKRVDTLLRKGTPRERVLAAIVKLLEHTLIRVGNEEYARENNSYGLTTLQTRHVKVSGAEIQFGFRGKGGVHHNVTVIHPELAKLVKACQSLPGRDLFQYRDEEGKCRAINSADVNDFLREISGEDFTAKDFRTWAGSVYALSELRKLNGASGREAKKGMVAIIKAVAQRLGNTPSVCKKSYVHPALLQAHTDGTLGVARVNGHRGPRIDEAEFLRFLKRLNGSKIASRKSAAASHSHNLEPNAFRPERISEAKTTILSRR